MRLELYEREPEHLTLVLVRTVTVKEIIGISLTYPSLLYYI